MILRRYAIGPRRVIECGRVHVAAARAGQDCCVLLLMITAPRTAEVTLTGIGGASTFAEAFQVARAELAPPVVRDDPPVIRQLELFATQEVDA